MNFNELLQLVRKEKITVAVDSRLVQAGGIFIAIGGVQADGATYIQSAINLGAKYVVCTEEVAQEQLRKDYKNVTFIIHADPRKAEWQLACAFYETENIWEDNINSGLKVIGITGTNGKTTISYLLEHLFISLGYKVGVLGTVSYRWNNYEEVAPLTTPSSSMVHSLLSRMYLDGVQIVLMEISSHALAQERVGGIVFAGAVFTNLTQDHLDYHKDMQNYFDAKAKLFTSLPSENKAFAINVDDAWGRKLVAKLKDKPLGYSFALHNVELNYQANNHLQGEICSMSPQGLHLKMHMQIADVECSWELHSPLVGAFNASNLFAVQSIALALGVKTEKLKYLETFQGVCGRLERVKNKKSFDVFVDYAHTPDALINVLQALQGAGFKKIITVFGCGGNRDRTKRPLMGEAVAKLAQVAVLTSDNPRNENPKDIIIDVLPGLVGVDLLDSTISSLKEGTSSVNVHDNLTVYIQEDRRLATKKALELLQEEIDKGEHVAVLIAGKGHEDYQIIGTVKHPYSDQKTVQELVACM